MGRERGTCLNFSDPIRLDFLVDMFIALESSAALASRLAGPSAHW